MERCGHASIKQPFHRYHGVSSLLPQAPFAVAISQCVEVVRGRRNQQTQLSNPISLLLSEVACMLDCGSVVFSRGLVHQFLHNVQQGFHAKIAIGVDMNLKAISPEYPHHLLQVGRRHDPLSIVTIHVAICHLHQLRIECAVTECLNVVGVHKHLVVTEFPSHFLNMFRGFLVIFEFVTYPGIVSSTGDAIGREMCFILILQYLAAPFYLQVFVHQGTL